MKSLNKMSHSNLLSLYRDLVESYRKMQDLDGEAFVSSFERRAKIELGDDVVEQMERAGKFLQSVEEEILVRMAFDVDTGDLSYDEETSI